MIPGRVIAVDVPAGHDGKRLGDFDLVFEITRTKNPFKLPKRVFLAEIKCQQYPMTHAEILELQARTAIRN